MTVETKLAKVGLVGSDVNKIFYESIVFLEKKEKKKEKNFKSGLDRQENYC